MSVSAWEKDQPVPISWTPILCFGVKAEGRDRPTGYLLLDLGPPFLGLLSLFLAFFWLAPPSSEHQNKQKSKQASKHEVLRDGLLLALTCPAALIILEATQNQGRNVTGLVTLAVDVSW